MSRRPSKRCLIWASLSLAASAYAQFPTMGAITPAGVSAAPSYGSSGFEQYNSFNGYLNASMPFHHIGGRGEAGFDLVWNLQLGWLAAYNGIPGVTPFVAVDPYPSDNIGWSMSRGGGNLNITLTNSTTAWSAFYHLKFLNPNPPTRNGWRPMGRVNQTFHLSVLGP